MKPITLLAAVALAATSVLPAQAAGRSGSTVAKGALIGGLAGAIIGHNEGRRAWQGAAYGAAAGAIVGSIVSHNGDRRSRYHHGPPLARPYRGGYGAWNGPRWGVGYGWGHHHRWSAFSPRWSARPWGYRSVWPVPPAAAYVYRPRPVAPSYPSHTYAPRGALLGGLAGAIIGHNQGRRGWEGAAYGLAGGYLLGSVLDARATPAAPQPAATPVVPAAPPQVTIINNYYSAAPSGPLAGANQLFGR